MNQPSIYLIGGPPGAGKSTLGISLATRLTCSYLTIDDLRTSLIAVTDPSLHPDLHVIGLPDPWTYFTDTDPTAMIDHAFAQHTALWPGIERVIRKRAGNHQSAVIEGWHLLPDLVANVESKAAHPIWIDVDHSVLEERERKVWDFYARSRDPELMLRNFLARSTRWNDLMRNSAAEHGYPTITQDGTITVDDMVERVLDIGPTPNRSPD